MPKSIFYVCGFIKIWTKEFNNTIITVFLFTTLIRPHLEYASLVWAPHYNCNIYRIERIQKNFVKFKFYLISSDPLNLPPYAARLKLLNLESLETRRQNADIVYIHQLISVCFDSPDTNLISIYFIFIYMVLDLLGVFYHLFCTI